MLRLLCIYLFTLVLLIFRNCENVQGAMDLNKETANLAHNTEAKNDFLNIMSEALDKANNRPDWFQDGLSRNPKRSQEEFNALLSELAAQDELFSSPLRTSIDREKWQNSPLLQYLVFRKQKKRSHEYNPRLGRSSFAASASDADDDENAQPKHLDTPLFAPRLGKKSLEFSPRLGRSFYSE